MELNPEFIREFGLAVTIVLFFGYLAWKYVNLKLEMMSKEFDHKLKERKYRLTGKMSKDDDNWTIDLDVVEVQ